MRQHDLLPPVIGSPGPPRLRVALPTAALFALTACSPGYVLTAGWEEAKLLERSRPIAEVVSDTAAGPDLRNKLRLVLQARDFAERALALRPGNSFTSYAPVEHDTLLLVISAAPRFRLSWKTWWFPVVGSVPYRGYFDFGTAKEEARRLRNEGWDVHVRPTSAFSTLGWLPDPVLSTTLRQDSVGIVQTVIHEITHATYFPSGHADFSESLATFAGHVGAEAFFCEALRREPACREARDRWHDTRRFGRFLTSLRDTLEAHYGRELPPDRMAAGKEAILSRAFERFGREVGPGFRSFPADLLERERMNNAWLLSRVLYYGRLGDFEAVRRERGSARAALGAVIEAARAASTPWRGLDGLVAGSRDTTTLPGEPEGGKTGAGRP